MDELTRRDRELAEQIDQLAAERRSVQLEMAARRDPDPDTTRADARAVLDEIYAKARRPFKLPELPRLIADWASERGVAQPPAASTLRWRLAMDPDFVSLGRGYWAPATWTGGRRVASGTGYPPADAHAQHGHHAADAATTYDRGPANAEPRFEPTRRAEGKSGAPEPRHPPEAGASKRTPRDVAGVMNPLTLFPDETKNLERVEAATSRVAFLTPTGTGLRKGIIDAVAPVRAYFERERYHFYETQPQGEIRQEPAVLVTDAGRTATVASLNRPRAKSGDPRIWISKLGHHASPGDLLALLVRGGVLHVVNLSKVHLDDPLSAARAFVDEVRGEDRAVMHELLGKMAYIAARGWIPATGRGDTAVGRTLEAELGLPMNPSKVPDYKGIELKSTRGMPTNRKTLFAQVPDWRISGAKSSAEILDRFGYARGAINKLYVTVSAVRINPQGLSLRLDLANDLLLEASTDPAMRIVAAWPLDLLRKRLAEKHAESFWVDAEERVDTNGDAQFRFNRVTYTRRPVVGQLESLIASGAITVDHLIKRDGIRVVEKGPLFKIDPRYMSVLFPDPETYDLREIRTAVA